MTALPTLPYETIETIIELRKQKVPATKIARQVGVHPQTVYLYSEDYRCPQCNRYIRADAVLCGVCRVTRLKFIGHVVNALYRK